MLESWEGAFLSCLLATRIRLTSASPVVICVPGPAVFSTSSMPKEPNRFRHPRLSIGVALVVGALVVLYIFFDWNWLRSPLEHYVTQKTHRVFRVADLKVRLGLTPVIRMRDVYFENAPWSHRQPMASIGQLEFSISLRALWHGQMIIPQLSLADAHVLLERTADGHKNWLLSDPEDRSPSRWHISTLHAERTELTYIDREKDFQVTIDASAISDRGLLHTTDPRFQTRLDFKGRYRDAPFSGEALTGNLVSLQQSDKPFPLLGHLNAGQTKVDVNGTVADVVDLSAIDAQVKVNGPTLSNLYPFLLLPLPTSPAYDIDGHLIYRGTQYTYSDFKGRIGKSDIRGDATYIARSPRPFLKIKLQSRVLDMVDLGPLMGIDRTSGSAKSPPPIASGPNKDSDTTSPNARSANGDDDRLLPRGKIDSARLKAIDAQVSLSAEHLQAPSQLAFESLRLQLNLKDGLMRMDPVDFGFAGGRIVGQITLNANVAPVAATISVEARGLDLAHFIPSSKQISPSEGKIAARIHLDGRGNSVGAVLADSNGSASAAIAGGRVSNLADALVGLNGAKILDLLATGDKNIALRCAAIDLDVKNGVGQTRTFVFDTEQTEILGSGSVNFSTEHFDIVLHPEPKHPSILSLRSPIHLSGSFKHPTFAVDKTAVIARAGGAIALGILSPLAALLPLLEPGPGRDADCAALFGRR